MARLEKQRVPLQAISASQRRLVESHLPLVHLTLRRHSSLASRCGGGREVSELVQEGCLALVEAVRSHDPTRHGHFASFAMARIHYAMSRYAHERGSLIRIPFITQRRRKQKHRTSTGDRHNPDALPRVIRANHERRTPSQNLARRLYSERMAGRSPGITIGDMVRECYDRAADTVVSQMRRSPRCTPELRELVDRCASERWTIPEPDERTPIRRLAASLGCSLGRVTHCEARFRRKVATLLDSDARYQALIGLGRHHTEGLRYEVSRRELVALRRVCRVGERDGIGGGLDAFVAVGP